MKKYQIEIKWAIIFTIVALLWMVIEKVLGWHDERIDKHAVYTSFFAIPSILIFLLALHDKKKHSFNGKMSYKQGLITGILISAFIAILTPYSAIHNAYIYKSRLLWECHLQCCGIGQGKSRNG